jgi:tetratricopeptide (TPR) repeat protein
MNKLLTIVATVSLCGQLLFAQGPNEGYIMENDAEQHVISHPDPVYPAIAKAVHLQGVVLIHADVDEHGMVTKVEAIGGPPMLRGAATDAVKHWTYQPFEVDRKASPVKIVVSVAFSLGIPSATEKSDQAIGQAYFPMDERCRSLLHVGKWSEAVSVCKDVADISDRFPDPSLRPNEIRLAHQDYGEALAFDGQLPDALKEFELVVANAEKYLKPTYAEYAAAYYWRAFAEHASGMRMEAERDYQTAEASYRKAMVNLPDMKIIYGRELAHTLAYHSILADQTGRAKEAETMRAEALTLDSKALDGMPKKE